MSEAREPNLAEALSDVWRLRRFILAGAFAGIVIAGMWSVLATPYYKASMILAPADPMNGAEISSLLTDDSVFALRYLIRRAGIENSSNFLRFENIYSGPAVAKMLIGNNDVIAGIAEDKAFTFMSGPGYFRSPAALSEYLKKNVRLEPVNGTSLRRLTYTHPDPNFAPYLISGIHTLSDALIRRTVKEEAEGRVAYLKEVSAETGNADHRRALTTLLMEQERLLMLASMDQPYVASVVEAASVSAKPVWPNVPLLMIAAGLIGAFAGLALGGAVRGGRAKEEVGQKPTPKQKPVSAKGWFSEDSANDAAKRAAEKYKQSDAAE